MLGLMPTGMVWLYFPKRDTCTSPSARVVRTAVKQPEGEEEAGDVLGPSDSR